ncbi:MAG: Crp/Fnr family transcriptional regulator [Burkholderiales bacterium]|nr:Crp/Fnr family transcriptional regulator [Burkholderiales bacterium]
MALLINHPDREKILGQLKTNIVLRSLKPKALAELEKQLSIMDCKKGDILVSQGDHEMEQFFVLEGVLKRVVSNPQGREMILRFAVEDDIDTSYAAWKLHTPSPYSIRAVSRGRVARMPLPAWGAFIDRHSQLKSDFEYEVMHLMSEVMAHTITLHLLDAEGRVRRFLRKRPDLYERVPKKELASYLNLSAETLSRLKHRDLG